MGEVLQKLRQRTIDGFRQAGARLYNEAILATMIGSASMRVTKQFESVPKGEDSPERAGVLQRRLEEGCGADCAGVFEMPNVEVTGGATT